MRHAFAAWVVLELLAAPAARAEKATAEARALYQKAITHYDLAEWDTAIAEFKQAYELTRDPGLLFNIAQSCRLKKDYQQALHFYQTYLALKQNAPNRSDAEAQIAKMKAALESAAPVAAPPPAVAPLPEAAPTPSAPLPRPPPPQSRLSRFAHSRRGQATIGLAAVGAAALISATGTGGEALSIRSRYDAGCATGSCDANLYAHGRSYAIATDVLIPLGIGVAVAATVVALVRPRERPVTLGMRF
jgi:tetratricopeptide (TPR) repeat protein